MPHFVQETYPFCRLRKKGPHVLLGSHAVPRNFFHPQEIISITFFKRNHVRCCLRTFTVRHPRGEAHQAGDGLPVCSIGVMSHAQLTFHHFKIIFISRSGSFWFIHLTSSTNQIHLSQDGPRGIDVCLQSACSPCGKAERVEHCQRTSVGFSATTC